MGGVSSNYIYRLSRGWLPFLMGLAYLEQLVIIDNKSEATSASASGREWLYNFNLKTENSTYNTASFLVFRKATVLSR